MSHIVVGLDIGTSFIRAVIAKVSEAQSDKPEIEVIGFAKKPSQGVRNGNIVNLDAAASVIKSTIDAAEQEAGEEVVSVFTAIGGSQTESILSTGSCGIDKKNRNNKNFLAQVDADAKRRAVEQATKQLFPLGKELIQIIARQYSVDGISEIKDPIGFQGVRLEVETLLITASVTAIENIRECVTRAQYFLENKMSCKVLAASESVLVSEEKDLGSIVIDLGGGTTDYMVWTNGAPVYSSSINIGQSIVTSDIATVKGVPFNIAEKIKLEYGCCYMNMDDLKEEVIIPGVGGKAPELTSRQEICAIMEARMRELMGMVKKDVIKNSGIKCLRGSIVLIGGGALMEGVAEMTQEVWQTSSVRVGCVRSLGFTKDDSYRDPDFATACGLVLLNREAGNTEKTRYKKASSEDSGIFDKAKGFLKKFF
ncbi:cell division protein FtsA [Treponema sp.]|uniref:cell division protein FtsA n=1 Tax=Treponema sp. TaxID=166 RepID=UPI0025F21D3E|nr:cell division protein FtsA [Treponema sp.]MCR5217189.1 cell division protein FtsA [Treponema sp.]